MAQARTQSLLPLFVAFLMTFFVLGVAGVASAAVDPSECPSADGTYKQNGRESFKVSAQIQQGIVVYYIDGARYFADGLDRQMPDGKTSYRATCKRGKLHVTVELNGRKRTIELSRFDAVGSLFLETDTKKDIADQILVNVASLQNVPAHKQSECPAHRTGKYINPKGTAEERRELKRVSTFFDDGNYILELGNMWRIDGTSRDVGNGVTYSGSCSNGVIYLSIFHDGVFTILRTYLNAGGPGPIHTVDYDARPSRMVFTYAYHLPEQPATEESKGSYGDQFPDDDDN